VYKSAANVPVESQTHVLQGRLTERISDPDQSNHCAVLSLQTKRAGPPQIETTSNIKQETEKLVISLQLLPVTDITVTDLLLATANVSEDVCHATLQPEPLWHSSNGKLWPRPVLNILHDESLESRVLTTQKYLPLGARFITKPVEDVKSFPSL
jgi:hypothetical protein